MAMGIQVFYVRLQARVLTTKPWTTFFDPEASKKARKERPSMRETRFEISGSTSAPRLSTHTSTHTHTLSLPLSRCVWPAYSSASPCCFFSSFCWFLMFPVAPSHTSCRTSDQHESAESGPERFALSPPLPSEFARVGAPDTRRRVPRMGSQ